MSVEGIPLQIGDSGPTVRDLHRRLVAAGFPAVGNVEVYDTDTVLAVRAFQASRRLVDDGMCGPQTWSALVEADFHLGDRMLYLRSPMTRGDDVTDLQQRLGGLGFDAGYVDGIFGPDTVDAVRAFQTNSGIPADGIVGPDTVDALARLAGRRAGEKTITEVREAERLRQGRGGLDQHRIVLGESGGLPGLIETLARRLLADGATVLTLHQPELSQQAQIDKEWNATVYLGVTLSPDDFSVGFFQTEGFHSRGGRQLALQASRALTSRLTGEHPVRGLRIPILRETRMPAIWCRLGQPAEVVERSSTVAEGFRDSLTLWSESPVEPPD